MKVGWTMGELCPSKALVGRLQCPVRSAVGWGGGSGEEVLTLPGSTAREFKALGTNTCSSEWGIYKKEGRRPGDDSWNL